MGKIKMIQTMKFEELPDELQFDLQRSYWTKINYLPLRYMAQETGLSINTLRTIRTEKKASYRTWLKLRDGIM